MLQVKGYICCETLSKRIQIQKSTSKYQEPSTPYLTARGDNRTTIKVIKVLRVKLRLLLV